MVVVKAVPSAESEVVKWQLGDVIEDEDGELYMIVRINRHVDFVYGVVFLNRNVVGVDTYDTIAELQDEWSDYTLIQEDLVIKPLIRK